MPDANAMIFHASARQRRTSLLIAAGFVVGAAALTAIGLLASAPFMVRFYALILAAALLIATYVAVCYVRAYTECTPLALRMRAFGRRREWPWAQVTGLALRPYQRGTTSALQVTLRNGRQFWLIVPALKGWAKDPDFAASAQKIIDYWRSAAAPDLALMGQRQELRDGPGVRIYRWVVIGVLSLLYVIALPVTAVQGGMAWAAHLGAGQHGYFLADSRCSGCGWIGTFNGNDGSVSYNVSLTDGSITGPGDEVPAISVAGTLYPAGGGSDWIYTTITGLIELAILYVLIHFWRRRRRRRQAATLAQPTPLPEPGVAAAARLTPGPRRAPTAPPVPRVTPQPGRSMMGVKLLLLPPRYRPFQQ